MTLRWTRWYPVALKRYLLHGAHDLLVGRVEPRARYFFLAAVIEHDLWKSWTESLTRYEKRRAQFHLAPGWEIFPAG